MTAPRESSKVTTASKIYSLLLNPDGRMNIEDYGSGYYITVTDLVANERFVLLYSDFDALYELMGRIKGERPKPPQSNLILDIIWTWLIKNGVEVSEEAKDEIEKRIKEVL